MRYTGIKWKYLRCVKNLLQTNKFDQTSCELIKLLKSSIKSIKQYHKDKAKIYTIITLAIFKLSIT